MKVYIAFCYFYLNLNKMSQAAKENSFDLSNNSIGDDGAKALSKMLKDDTSLTRLDLSNNSIGNKGAIALAEMLKDQYVFNTS
jgi:Ran GTPase-activating protein (RanGAP) involved in mRNA processing and transport